MMREQADHYEQQDVPDRECGEGTDGVLECGVHHRVLDAMGKPLRDEVGYEIVEVPEQEHRQGDQHYEHPEYKFWPRNPAVDHPMVKAGSLQKGHVLPCVVHQCREPVGITLFEMSDGGDDSHSGVFLIRQETRPKPFVPQ